MQMLDRKLRRDLRGSWRQLVTVTAILATGIGCFIGMLSSSRNLFAARSVYYADCRMADFWLDVKKAPVEEVRRRSAVAGISEVRERLQFDVMLDLDAVDEPLSGLMLSLPSESAPVLNGIVMRQGSYFTPDRVNEVIVGESFAEARGIAPGDTLALVLNERREEVVVVGTAISAEFVYLTSPGSMIDEPGTYGLFWAKRSFLEDAFGFEGACNSVVGRFAPDLDEGRQQAALDELDERLSEFGVFSVVPRADQFSHLTLESELKQLRSMAVIFPSFFLFVAALVLNVLMSRLAEQQRTILGTLKALGYGNRALTWHLLQFGAAAGLLGGVLGGAFGYWFAGSMSRMYLHYFAFPEMENRVYPGLLFVGLILALAACVVGTLQGVRHNVALPPAEAMRPAPPPTGGRILLERWHGLWSRFDITWQMALRGLFRQKRRTVVALVSAALGAAIVLLAFGFVDSIDMMIQRQFDQFLRSDYHLTFSKELDREVVDEVSRLPGVVKVEPVFSVACTFEAGHRSKKGGIIGLAPGSQLTVPSDDTGRAVERPEVGLLMANRLMRQLDLRPGDEVRIVPVRGERRPLSVPAARGFASMLGMEVYADQAWLGRLLGERASASEVRLLARHRGDERRDFLHLLKQMPNLESVTDIREQRRALERQFEGAMRISALIMILFAAVIFLGSIFNATLIALAERQRELATFSALGYRDRESARLFFRENLVVNLAGTAVGIPLGMLMLQGTMGAFETDAYSLPVDLRASSILYTIVLAGLFVCIAQVAVHRGLRHLDRVRALNIQE